MAVFIRSNISWEVYKPISGEIKNLYHVESTNLHNSLLNRVVKNTLKFDYNYSTANLIKDSQKLVTFGLRKDKTLWAIYTHGLTCLWDSLTYDIIIKSKGVK